MRHDKVAKDTGSVVSSQQTLTIWAHGDTFGLSTGKVHDCDPADSAGQLMNRVCRFLAWPKFRLSSGSVFRGQSSGFGVSGNEKMLGQGRGLGLQLLDPRTGTCAASHL